ncbi:MAG TPA: hypothetical protein VLA90_03165 [Actinomycetota bacterium]|nr:hypothetical protein [Actinomycetota bacterium]
MGYLIVVAASVVVGVAAYVATMRAGRERPAAVGFDPEAEDGEPATVEAPGPGYTYLRIPVRGPSWRDRIEGVVGLLVLLFVASTVLAFGMYQLGHLVNVIIERFLER